MDTGWSPFTTTHWSLILSAANPADEAEASPALSRLCQTYWPPLYAFLRRRGFTRADAQDLVQGFFQRVLERDILRRADRDRGRFRTFLLAALQNYVANQERTERALKRGGGRQPITLDNEAILEGCEAGLVSEMTPELAFDRLWAETVMNNAAQRLRTEYASRERMPLYDELCRWLARDPGPGEYAEAAPRLGLTEGALAAAVFRLRRRFRELVRDEVAQTVQTPESVQEEVRYLLHVLTSP